MKFLQQILCHVVGDVFFRRDVYDAELVLADTIVNPMESHIFIALLRFCLMVSFASTMADVLSVVAYNCSGRLRVSNIG